jgi:hypothetical protein
VEPQAPRQEIDLGSVAVDGLFAGILGALAVALTFLVLDLLRGEPLHTPSVLGTLLFRGSAASHEMGVDVPMAVAYNGVHFLAFVIGGLLASYVATLLDRAPRYWYLGFVAVAFLLAGILYADAAVDVAGLGRMRLFTGALVGILVMGAYLWWCHPGIAQHVEDVWED